MKAQPSKPKRGTRKPPAVSHGNKNQEKPSTTISASMAEVEPDDLHACIMTRAYELYVERGCREGCAHEDWLDAEREIVTR